MAAGLDVTRTFYVTLGSQAKKLDPFHGSSLTNGRCLQNQLLFLLVSALPFREEFLFLLAHVMKHSSNGSQSPQLGELAAHLADLKKSEALRTSQAPEIRKYLEQLNATQRLKATSLNAFAPCPLRPQAVTLGESAWPGRRHWPRALIARIRGRLTIRSARQANARVDAVIAAMPTAAHACLLAEQRHDKQRQWSLSL